MSAENSEKFFSPELEKTLQGTKVNPELLSGINSTNAETRGVELRSMLQNVVDALEAKK